MERQVINPWTWQDQYGFVQANRVIGAERQLICSGQLSVDAQGEPINPGDMSAQILQALDNIQTVLQQARFQFSDVVRLNYYTTDVDAFIAAGPTLGRRLAAGNCRPAATLLGVAGLAVPGCMIEIEALAMA
jgi:enamine deaminase RidA (YjgF/YER057c/UK114 family)